MKKAFTGDDFKNWFSDATGYAGAQSWQSELANRRVCSNRLIRIPTGLGKTLGVLSTWLFHRVEQPENSWPRRLVWCLPMRTLVEQTVAEAQIKLPKECLAAKCRLATLCSESHV